MLQEFIPLFFYLFLALVNSFSVLLTRLSLLLYVLHLPHLPFFHPDCISLSQPPLLSLFVLITRHFFSPGSDFVPLRRVFQVFSNPLESHSFCWLQQVVIFSLSVCFLVSLPLSLPPTHCLFVSCSRLQTGRGMWECDTAHKTKGHEQCLHVRTYIIGHAHLHTVCTHIQTPPAVSASCIKVHTHN